jgi:MFS family permease
MLTPWLIVVVAACSLLILFIASILSIYAATDTYKSPDYNKDIGIRNAHTYSTVSACIGFVIFALLLALFIMIAIKIWALNVDFKDIKYILNKNVALTREERAKLKEESTDLRNLRHSLTILIILYGLGGIIGCFIVGVLTAVAATKLSNATQSPTISKAYTMTIIAAILGITASLFSMLAVVFGFLITNEEKKMDMTTETVLSSPMSSSPSDVMASSVVKKQAKAN